MLQPNTHCLLTESVRISEVPLYTVVKVSWCKAFIVRVTGVVFKLKS